MKTSLATAALFFAVAAFPVRAQSPAATTSPMAHGLETPSSGVAPVSPSSANPAAPSASAGGMPNEAEMMKQMQEMAKLNENHRLLADLNGDWNYTVTMWMTPGAPPMKAAGAAIRQSVLGGRYVEMKVEGKMKMPGEDGKLKDVDFKGVGLEGYDNVKKKFVGTWLDNMGTGIMLSEGDYDPSSKTFTYVSEVEMTPGMKTKVRETLKVIDKDHMTFEWYENHGGQDTKTMQLDYTRRK